MVVSSVPTAMIRKLMEYSANCVKMPARMAGIRQAVCRRPVSKPASIPERTASSIATQGLTPKLIPTAQTAPPVAREPSTVKSATSRIRYVI